MIAELALSGILYLCVLILTKLKFDTRSSIKLFKEVALRLEYFLGVGRGCNQFFVGTQILYLCIATSQMKRSLLSHSIKRVFIYFLLVCLSCRKDFLNDYIH